MKETYKWLRACGRRDSNRSISIYLVDQKAALTRSDSEIDRWNHLSSGVFLGKSLTGYDIIIIVETRK